VFFALYYVMLMGGQSLADQGKLSPMLGTWMPNILLVLPVAELFSRAFFETPLFWRWRVRLPRLWPRRAAKGSAA
jgi:hypothetical protein